MPGDDLPSSTLPHCPDESVLTRLIAGDLATEEALILETHLTQCENCRAAIERLSEVAEFTALAVEASAGNVLSGEGVAGDSLSGSSIASPSLRGVMERLLIESQVMEGSVNFAAVPSRNVLPALQPSPRPGFIGRLGDIDIRKVIGRGGMGVVFEGEDSILNRPVAVKVLSPHLVSDGDAKSRFLREARAAAALTHENVVSIHSINEADGMPYLVLQYVSGESLSERLQRKQQLDFEEVLRIGIEIARGLSAAHKQGLVHRDIKPANILLESESGAVRITDFGLAKHADNDSITKLGAIAGTPAYMSPEQSTNGELDGRSDLFSVGVVLYEASTGVSPFAADSPFVILNNIRTQAPVSVCKLNPALPAWFGTIIDRLLAKRPQDRIESASLLAEALEQRGRTPLTRTVTSKFSNSIWFGLAVAGVAVLAVSLTLYFGSTPFANSNVVKSVNPSPVPLSGFVVDEQSQAHATLEAAIAAAQNDSIITIYGDGPFPSRLTTIAGKRLTIRAAAGYIPRFVPAASIASASPRFIASDTDLRLEGIEVNWPIDAPPIDVNSPQLGFDDAAERCVISSLGQLQVDHCRIVAGRLGTCLGAGLGEVTITNCHFVSASGTAIAWRPFVSKVNVEQCLFESKVVSLCRSSTSVTDPTIVRFDSNTVVSERVFSVLAGNPVRKQLELHVSHNVLKSQYIASLFLSGGFRPFQESRMSEVLQEVIAWHDEENTYQQGTVYLAVNPIRQPLRMMASNLDSLDKWLTFWSQPDSKSIEGEIKLTSESPFSIDEIESPTGAIPVELGADLGNVGPRSKPRPQ
jgi:serine/threonine protein kinase